ncbi:MAG: nucleotide exchange factor GrpE [Bdellovibrionales bacterium]|nr:nucleotide exchange factor GrpE [Bdellovibrionales bacterium]
MNEKKHEIEIDPTLIDEAMESVEERRRKKNDPESSEEKKDSEENWHDQFIRLAADFDNFRKRTQKEKSELVRFGNETLLREILPVIDNFERAVEHAKKASDVDSIRQGVEMILSQLRTTLEQFGLSTKAAKNKVFDPTIHEAVSQVATDEQKPNTVLEEHQKAYFLHDRLIRPAVVTVSKEVEEPSDSNTETNENEISTKEVD